MGPNHFFLEYLSLFQPLPPCLETLECCSDGLVFWQLLIRLPHFSSRSIPTLNCRTFIQKYSNLKILYDALEGYWSSQLHCEMSCDDIDLVEIANTGEAGATEQLIELVIKTIVHSPAKDFFIEKMLQTSQETQRRLQEIVETVSKKSPRKQKEQRMYEKIAELEHENQELRTVFEKICESKLEIEAQLKETIQKVHLRDKDIAALNELIMDQPERQIVKEDQNAIIDHLRLRLAEQASSHSKQIQVLLAELAHKHELTQYITKLQAQVVALQGEKEHSRIMEKRCCEVQAEGAKISLELRQSKEDLQRLKDDLRNSDLKLEEFRERQTELQLEMQRKNIQIELLKNQSGQIEKQMSSEAKSTLSTLFSECSYVNDRQIEVLLDSNKRLRFELDRALKRLKIFEQNQQVATQHTAAGEALNQENAQLKRQLADMAVHKDNEISVLMAALFRLTAGGISPIAKVQKNQRKLTFPHA